MVSSLQGRATADRLRLLTAYPSTSRGSARSTRCPSESPRGCAGFSRVRLERVFNLAHAAGSGPSRAVLHAAP
jgi:hypothetical protein